MLRALQHLLIGIDASAVDLVIKVVFLSNLNADHLAIVLFKI